MAPQEEDNIKRQACLGCNGATCCQNPNMGIEEALIALRSPWQNPAVRRVIAGIRRELLAHVIALNDWHLTRLLQFYLGYDHGYRTHRALDVNTPVARRVQPPELGRVWEVPKAGSLHHR
jgi:hypothetical protein